MAVPPRTAPPSWWYKLRYDPSGKLMLLGLLAGIVLFFAAVTASFRLTSYAWIRAQYGSDAYRAGLRVIDNKGNLSNGDKLSGLGHFVVYIGSFAVGAPLPLAYLVWYRRWANQSYTRYEQA